MGVSPVSISSAMSLLSFSASVSNRAISAEIAFAKSAPTSSNRPGWRLLRSWSSYSELAFLFAAKFFFIRRRSCRVLRITLATDRVGDAVSAAGKSTKRPRRMASPEHLKILHQGVDYLQCVESERTMRSSGPQRVGLVDADCRPQVHSMCRRGAMDRLAPATV
jgi:hypothetical protein